MSVTHEMDPGCTALGHLFRPDGDRKVCITCGHVQGDRVEGNRVDGGASDTSSQE